jgi:ketosteroid isomerase-like protein
MFPSTIRGREALREILRWHNMQYEMMPTRLHRLLIDGDQAIAHRTSGLRERGGGPVYTFDCVTLARFRDGLIVEFQEFVDGSGRDFINAFPR